MKVDHRNTNKAVGTQKDLTTRPSTSNMSTTKQGTTSPLMTLATNKKLAQPSQNTTLYSGNKRASLVAFPMQLPRVPPI